MRLRHLFVLVMLAAALILLHTGCSEDTGETDPYGIQGLTKAMEQYNEDLSDVETVEDYTRAMETYTEKINELKPKLEKLLEEAPQVFQNPEMRKLPKGMDEEDLEKLVQAMERNMALSLDKYKGEYMDNEEFAEAMAEMQEANSILF
jgi:uncharacterized protein YecA (UPF0149 family)